MIGREYIEHARDKQSWKTNVESFIASLNNQANLQLHLLAP